MMNWLLKCLLIYFQTASNNSRHKASDSSFFLLIWLNTIVTSSQSVRIASCTWKVLRRLKKKNTRSAFLHTVAVCGWHILRSLFFMNRTHCLVCLSHSFCTWSWGIHLLYWSSSVTIPGNNRNLCHRLSWWTKGSKPLIFIRKRLLSKPMMLLCHVNAISGGSIYISQWIGIQAFYYHLKRHR